MLKQILSMANSHLPEVLVDSHSCLVTKLLAQNTFAALLTVAKFVQFKGVFMAPGQSGDQFIQQRFA